MKLNNNTRQNKLHLSRKYQENTILLDFTLRLFLSTFKTARLENIIIVNGIIAPMITTYHMYKISVGLSLDQDGRQLEIFLNKQYGYKNI